MDSSTLHQFSIQAPVDPPTDQFRIISCLIMTSECFFCSLSVTMYKKNKSQQSNVSSLSQSSIQVAAIPRRHFLPIIISLELSAVYQLPMNMLFFLFVTVYQRNKWQQINISTLSQSSIQAAPVPRRHSLSLLSLLSEAMDAFFFFSTM